MRHLVTGAAGQDGFYLCSALQGEVYALYRGQDESRLSTLEAELPHVRWVRGDVSDPISMQTVLRDIQPDNVFNLAAASFVGHSWEMPGIHMEVNYGGVLNLLEAVRWHAPNARIVQASTSEMYGNLSLKREGLNENSPMRPASPYGVSKLAAHELCRVYRESYGMHVSCAISFNHESPKRPPIFVTRKVTKFAARAAGVILREPYRLELGSLDVYRDWGFAGDYVKAYILMAQAESPDDYVVGTGEAHSVGELVSTAFDIAGVSDWGRYVSSDMHHRPNEIEYLCADPSKIRSKLGWQAETSFEELVTMMVEADREKVLV